MHKLGFLVLLTLLAQNAAAQPMPDIYAKPQQRVMLPGGHAINLVCTGTGTPTVILTAGAGDWSVTWRRIQGPVAKRMRVCAWDRPGLGFSDGSDQPLTAAIMADDLDKTLSGAGIAGPYLLVAHSSGAYETLMFALRHPGSLAGLVLVDPSLPAMPKRIAAISPLAASALRADFANRASAFHHCAADPLHVSAADAAICFHIPESAQPIAGIIDPLNHQPSKLATLATLYEQFETSADTVAAALHGFGAMPIAILTSENQPLAALPTERPDRARALGDLWRTTHDELAALSSTGTNQVIAGASHPIQWEHPEAVISAILKIADKSQHR